MADSIHAGVFNVEHGIRHVLINLLPIAPYCSKSCCLVTIGRLKHIEMTHHDGDR